MKRVLNQLHVKLVFLSYLYALAVFFLFRLLLFVLEQKTLSAGGDYPELITIIKAFLMGVRFDLTISGYVMFLPFLILTVLEFIGRPALRVKKAVLLLIVTVFSLSFLVCASDIPFFSQFYSRFNVSAFLWADHPGFVLRMIVLEPRYWISIIPLIICIVLYYKLLKRAFDKSQLYESGCTHWSVKTISFLVVATLIFAGVRGRIQAKSPIRVGTAYFSENSFLNQLGLNPNFTLIRSYLSSNQSKAKEINIMDSQQALSNVQSYLKVTPINPDKPIARKRNINDMPSSKHNIVLVIMESMSAGKMGRYGNEDNLTPFLDSIAHESYSFDKIYTAGIHTFNGVYGTLFSFPSIFLQHPMIDVAMLKYNGISNILKKHDYSSVYFTTHDGQFDNAEGFLINNDFDRIIEQSSYPEEKVKTGLGVPDDYMFRFSMPIIDELGKADNPFLAVFMTASDHGPYYIPDYFSPKHSNDKLAIVEYADWSLKQLIKNASKYDWFDNTLFVFIADHGAAIAPIYETPLNYYHTPLIIYGSEIIKPQSFNKIGGQIDVFPTLMGILNLPYTNNTFGIDLLQEEREYIYFNGDNKYGVLNDEFLFISKIDGPESLYKYSGKDRKNYIEEYPNLADSMRTYGKSNIQAAQYIIQNNRQLVLED